MAPKNEVRMPSRTTDAEAKKSRRKKLLADRHARFLRRSDRNTGWPKNLTAAFIANSQETEKNTTDSYLLNKYIIESNAPNLKTDRKTAYDRLTGSSRGGSASLSPSPEPASIFNPRNTMSLAAHAPVLSAQRPGTPLEIGPIHGSGRHSDLVNLLNESRSQRDDKGLKSTGRKLLEFIRANPNDNWDYSSSKLFNKSAFVVAAENVESVMNRAGLPHKITFTKGVKGRKGEKGGAIATTIRYNRNEPAQTYSTVASEANVYSQRDQSGQQFTNYNAPESESDYTISNRGSSKRARSKSPERGRKKIPPPSPMPRHFEPVPPGVDTYPADAYPVTPSGWTRGQSPNKTHTVLFKPLNELPQESFDWENAIAPTSSDTTYHSNQYGHQQPYTQSSFPVSATMTSHPQNQEYSSTGYGYGGYQDSSQVVNTSLMPTSSHNYGAPIITQHKSIVSPTAGNLSGYTQPRGGQQHRDPTQPPYDPWNDRHRPRTPTAIDQPSTSFPGYVVTAPNTGYSAANGDWYRYPDLYKN